MLRLLPRRAHGPAAALSIGSTRLWALACASSACGAGNIVVEEVVDAAQSAPGSAASDPTMPAATGDAAAHGGAEAGSHAATDEPTDAGADAGADASRDGAVAQVGSSEPVTSRGLRIVGRADTRDPESLRFAWSGSGVAARFTGTGLSMELAGDAPWLRLAVVVDGAPGALIAVSDGDPVYRVAEGLSPGPHTLVVTRETEGQMGTTILGAVEVVGGTLLAPGEQPRPLIELVGDSISAGFGDLGADQSCGYSYDTQSFAQTYGALAARTLGGEAVGIAMSSHGLYRNLDGSTDMLLPAIYERAVTNDGAAQWTAPLHPDVIVVNLGTNDFNAAADDPSQPFQEAYLAFVRTLRTLHPDALIVAAFGGMLGDDGPPSLSRLRDSIRAVLAARMLAGDARLAALEFPRNGPADLGCAWHPNAHKHAVMADQLVALLRDHGL